MPIEVRSASPHDAEAMAELLNRIISAGGTTAYRQPFDGAGIVSEFIEPKLGICCHIASDELGICGFQALLWCDPDWTGPDKLPSDWAVIATYVDPDRHGKGVGRALFGCTSVAAKNAGVSYIDATIRRENTGGLGYYSRMGFVDYRSGSESVSKRFALV